MKMNYFKKKAFLLFPPTIILAVAGGMFAEVEDSEETKKGGSVELPEGLIEALGHEDFKKRREGQNELLLWGKKDLQGGIEALYRIYREAENPEVRLRGREVLKALVILKQPLPGQGYLGIQMDTARWKDEKGMMRPAVLITDVRKGTAADLANLKANDLITGLDEVLFDDLAPTRRLADYIKSKGPGDKITLKVKRGQDHLELTASLRRRPTALDEITQWGVLPVLPQETEMDEDYFQEWLKKQREKDRKSPRD
ncbi:MAG: hypothetical protein CMP30_04980 [Roseibacillus sp.]|nr:hypothetical protein [Roseibacillus sp.]